MGTGPSDYPTQLYLAGHLDSTCLQSNPSCRQAAVAHSTLHTPLPNTSSQSFPFTVVKVHSGGQEPPSQLLGRSGGRVGTGSRIHNEECLGRWFRVKRVNPGGLTGLLLYRLVPTLMMQVCMQPLTLSVNTSTWKPSRQTAHTHTHTALTGGFILRDCTVFSNVPISAVAGSTVACHCTSSSIQTGYIVTRLHFLLTRGTREWQRTHAQEVIQATALTDPSILAREVLTRGFCL